MNAESSLARKTAASGGVMPDDQDFGWVGIGVDVHDDQGVVDGMADIEIRDPVTAGGLVDLHTSFL
ncbi:MAG: hypothetical protein QOD57_1772 [Actinomycetota bacterium]|nr:hypothetical protein [Actinomycetota bacterium]MDQ1504045.1 hypothetical protein [Actinomycetota bacterium]